MILLGTTIGALAQSAPVPPDVSVTSIGVQTWTDTAIQSEALLNVPPPTDADVILGQRLRWTLAGDRMEAGPDVMALLDARFTIDPGPVGTPTFEWSQVRQAGVEVLSGPWTVDLGRHPVYRGGPRLVDGVQALYAPSPTVRVGVWGGLAPNLFTTLPEIRPGGGPIVSYATSEIQVSAVGEVITFDGGIDRVGLLALARASFERRLDLSARLDVEVVGPEGPRLVDGQAVVIGHPIPSLRIDVLYDGFSSYRYVDPLDVDPDIERFVQRLSALGLAPLVPYEAANPTLNHLVGGGVRFEPDTDDVAPRIGLTARYRTNPELETSYARVNPQLGVVRVAGMLDVLADVNYIVLDEGAQLDGGVLLYLAPDGPFSVDASGRAVLAPDALGALGFYGDLFVNVVSPELDLLVIVGGMASSEPDVIDLQADVGFGGFVRIAKYLRPAR